MILLDTDIIIDILREYPPAVTWINSLGKQEIALSGFAAMELIQGCRNKAELRKVERSLKGYSTIWPSPETCDRALSVFVGNYLSHSIGIIDSLIGQTAVDLKLPLHTFNQKHYKAVPDLEIIQPYPRK